MLTALLLVAYWIFIVHLTKKAKQLTYNFDLLIRILTTPDNNSLPDGHRLDHFFEGHTESLKFINTIAFWRKRDAYWNKDILNLKTL